MMERYKLEIVNNHGDRYIRCEPAPDGSWVMFRDVAALQKRVAELDAENAALRNNKTEEEALREMMRDPRYWRHRDPEWVNKVRDGFRKLTGGKDE